MVNNEFLGPLYNKGLPKTGLLYFDATNLYGWAMEQDMPEGEFTTALKEEIESINANLTNFITGVLFAPTPGRGFVADVDLDYPAELHDAHNAYPMAPEKRAVREDELSEYSVLLNSTVNKKHPKSCVMLLQTLGNKRHYFVYYKNLAFYVKHGLKLRKVHRIVWFKEHPIIKSYIETNTIMRNAATSLVERNVWKNANNSIFGKFMQDQLNQAALEMVSTVEEFNKVVADPGFHGAIFQQDDFMIATVLYKEVEITKPIYLGMVITELAKLHMYEFYYDILQPFFGWQNLELCMTDTDSLFLKVTIPAEKLAENPNYDIYNAIADINRDYGCPIDTSGFSPETVSKYNIPSYNNSRIGYFKSETGDRPIHEFVGLRAKAYSYRIWGEGPDAKHLRLKGVGKAAIKDIEHEAFRLCIHNELDPGLIQQEVTVPLIRARMHNIYSILTRKIGLSCNDTKRFIMADNIHTLAFGHYKTAQAREEVAIASRIKQLEVQMRKLLDEESENEESDEDL